MEALANQRDWAQKYRPQKLEDMILPSRIMDPLLSIRDKKQGMSLLFHGKAGTGKTTAARLLHENTFEMNCSKERGIAHVHLLEKICRTASVWDDFRAVLLDEADYLTSDAQASLRGLIEQMSFGNMFVFTANYPDRLSEPLHSRLYPVDFSFNPGDVKLKQKMVDRVCEILEHEGINPDSEVVKTIVREYFPDMRRILKRLQFEIGLKH